MTLRERLRPAGRALRANLLPGFVLQGFALSIVLGYFSVPSFRDWLDVIGLAKERWGYAFSALSTALFGGLIPYLVLLGRGRVPPDRRGLELVFFLAFWIWKGVEVDALYRLQARIFGAEATFSVIAYKVLLDQFVYNPARAAPTQTLAFAFKDAGFSLEETRRRLRIQSLAERSLVVLLSTWLVWIPAVAIIYSLPSLLQLPLFNLVLCFWCLLLAFVSREQGSGGGSGDQQGSGGQ